MGGRILRRTGKIKLRLSLEIVRQRGDKGSDEKASRRPPQRRKTAHADPRMTTDRLIYKNLSSYLAFKLMIAREILTFFNIFFFWYFF